MWTPYIRTIFLMIFLINAFLTLMIFAYWKTQRTHDGFALWAVSLLFQSFAYFLFMLRGEVSDLLSIPVANVLSMLAMIMRIDAIRRFIWAKPIPVWYYTLLVPIFITYCYFTYIADSMILRALISTIFLAPCLIIAGILTLKSHEKENRILRYLFAASLMIPSFVLLIRLAAWLVMPGEYTIFSTDAFNTAFFVIAMIADILATGFFLMLNMIKSQKELRQTNEKLSLLSGITRRDIRNQLQIYADPLFGKVFYNLIDNALKYGGGKITSIGITAHETGSGLTLVCEDDGPGIAGEDKRHLFERGFGKNTGLGLFLSREILSITGITIRETSNPGSGARFEMDVPKGTYRFVRTVTASTKT